MQHPPPDPNFQGGNTGPQPRRGLSTGAKFGIVALAVAVLVASAIAVVSLQRTRDLESRLADRERAPEGAGGGEGNGNPLEDLFGGGDLGRLEDLFGGEAGGLGGLGPQNPNLLQCLAGGGGGGGGLGDLFGGGRGGLEDLFGGDSGEAKPVEPARLVRQISRQVEKLRELEFNEPVEARFLSNAQLKNRISKLFLRDYSARDADQEQRLLSLLGAIDPGEDVRSLRRSALEGQVAGFYVPETKELVVRKVSGGVGALEKVTLAHELEHALADQDIGLPVADDTDPATADADLAALSVVEGDATLTMQQYSLQNLSLSDQLGMATQSGALQSQQQLAAMPYYLQQELTFPYIDGLNFVCERYLAGGWKAVNRTYVAPPASSDQILFPDRYDPSAEPADPRDPAALSAPWERGGRASIGAAQLKWLFSAPGDDQSKALPDPGAAAAAWGGGEAALWTDGDRSALGLALVQRNGSDGLCKAVGQWYAAAFEDDSDARTRGDETLVLDGATQDAVLTCDGNQVRLGIGPTLDVARQLAR